MCGETIHVSELKPVAGVEFMDHPNQAVVLCVAPQVEEVAATTAGGAAPADGAAAPAGGAAAPAAGAAAPAAGAKDAKAAAPAAGAKPAAPAKK